MIMSAFILVVGVSVDVANAGGNVFSQQEQANAKQNVDSKNEDQVVKQEVDPTIQKPLVKQEPKQDAKRNVAQETKRENKQDAKRNVAQETKQEPKQDARRNIPQESKQDAKQDSIAIQRSKTRIYGSNWKVGDAWSVSVTRNQIQGVNAKLSKPTKFDFKVEKIVNIRGSLCFQVKLVFASNPKDHPIVYFWVDVENGAMKRVTTYDWNGEEWREHTEFFNGSEDRPIAVLLNATTVPIAMPIFPIEGVKDLTNGSIGSGSYDATSVNTVLPGVKDVEESAPIRFEVQETVREITPEGAKLIGVHEESEFAKALTDKAANEALEVEITLGDEALGTCKQIWTPNAPWPVYSKIGGLEAVLVETILQD